jgi:hypothetical protein
MQNGKTTKIRASSMDLSQKTQRHSIAGRA